MRPVPQSRSRPALALVIGSGGVRSIAAAGVVEVLAREGVHADVVAGCSSGALFGATIAMGLSSSEVLRAATDLWSAELTQQRRWRAYAQLVAPKLARFDSGFSMRDDRLIRQRLDRAFGALRIEELPGALRIVATDAASGDPVVLTNGGLVTALRASMAVPLIFPSVEIDGRTLVDGVISDPLPIAAAADADAVIALGFEGGMPRRVDRVSRMVGQVTTAMINNLQRARLAAARTAGQSLLCIDLDLDRRIGLWETGAMAYLLDAGRRSAEARLPEILAMVQRPRQAHAA